MHNMTCGKGKKKKSYDAWVLSHYNGALVVAWIVRMPLYKSPCVVIPDFYYETFVLVWSFETPFLLLTFSATIIVLVFTGSIFLLLCLLHMHFTLL